MGFPINCLTLSWSAPVSLGLGGPTNPSLVGGSTKSCVKLEIFPPIVVLLVFPTIVLLTIKLGVYNTNWFAPEGRYLLLIIPSWVSNTLPILVLLPTSEFGPPI